MINFNSFMEFLCGDFDNRAQCRKEEEFGERIHPYAKHIIGKCNDKMLNLPLNFTGQFVIEESYFDLGDQKIEKHYLFLYQVANENIIKLTSYEIPVGIEREAFTNKNKQLQIDYQDLVVSPRFEPLELIELNGAFFGENISRFSVDTLFKFSLRVVRDKLYVKEVLERNGEKVAGFYEPTIYDKVVF